MTLNIFRFRMSYPGLGVPVLLLLLILMLSGTAAATCLGGQPLRGVNLAGAEFNSKQLPGTMYRDYTYPKAEEFEYFSSKGANTIRLPIRWERVQHELFGPLEDSEMAAIEKALAQAREYDMCLILDIHNYGTYRDTPIGAAGVPKAALADLWIRLAQALNEPNNVALGLMNEPAKLAIAEWGVIAQETLDALRASGSEHLIMVSGGRWSGVHEWFKPISGVTNAETFAKLEDPLKRAVIEVHQYADSYYSGTGEDCHEPSHFNGMFEAIGNWASNNGLQLFLGEFGVPASSDCLAALDRMLSLASNPDVWRGWTYWAAGAWWGDYFLSIAPRNGVDAPQMAVVEPYLDKDNCTESVSAGCPLPPSDFQVDGAPAPADRTEEGIE